MKGNQKRPPGPGDPGGRNGQLKAGNLQPAFYKKPLTSSKHFTWAAALFAVACLLALKFPHLTAGEISRGLVSLDRERGPVFSEEFLRVLVAFALLRIHGGGMIR